MRFHLFQPIPSDARYHEVNSAGRSNFDWGNPHLDLTSWLQPEAAAGRVTDALDAEFFTHACTVEAGDLEALFAFANGVAPDAGRLLASYSRGRSGSVGDVALSDDGKAYACCSFGWAELPDGLAGRFKPVT
ncbi:hypothetical protein [Tropicimonas sp. IMCC6043]|uniref:hypothetical protein n=1 Tax=Tropicimonas sp. IMCC6043 TaxID=2510645 RepID=UPI00101CBEC4|nr:hypothetical protein [Tropicimonas sp. IMCC6043]RYH06727.1 hypothetical protein EU800_22745 [Tropicimonas sp. IMCC6043]